MWGGTGVRGWSLFTTGDVGGGGGYWCEGMVVVYYRRCFLVGGGGGYWCERMVVVTGDVQHRVHHGGSS